mgnify:CR=1 FL=1
MQPLANVTGTVLTAARLFGFFMALKATIFKVDLSVADMDRNVYSDFALTLARHPSENDIRMMVRLFAFMLLADERLEFGKGLSTDEEPDLWLKDLTGAIDQWVVVGQPDERWLRKASGRAGKVFVFTYGDRLVDVWWEQNQTALSALKNLTVLRLSGADAATLATLVSRSMSLQCTIQEGEALIAHDNGSVRVAPAVLQRLGV